MNAERREHTWIVGETSQTPIVKAEANSNARKRRSTTCMPRPEIMPRRLAIRAHTPSPSILQRAGTWLKPHPEKTRKGPQASLVRSSRRAVPAIGAYHLLRTVCARVPLLACPAVPPVRSRTRHEMALAWRRRNQTLPASTLAAALADCVAPLAFTSNP